MALSRDRKSHAMKGALHGLMSEMGALNVDRAKKKKQKMPMRGMPPKGMGKKGGGMMGGGHMGH